MNPKQSMSSYDFVVKENELLKAQLADMRQIIDKKNLYLACKLIQYENGLRDISDIMKASKFAAYNHRFAGLLDNSHSGTLAKISTILARLGHSTYIQKGQKKNVQEISKSVVKPHTDTIHQLDAQYKFQNNHSNGIKGKSTPLKASSESENHYAETNGHSAISNESSQISNSSGLQRVSVIKRHSHQSNKSIDVIDLEDDCNSPSLVITKVVGNHGNEYQYESSNVYSSDVLSLTTSETTTKRKPSKTSKDIIKFPKTKKPTRKSITNSKPKETPNGKKTIKEKTSTIFLKTKKQTKQNDINASNLKATLNLVKTLEEQLAEKRSAEFERKKIIQIIQEEFFADAARNRLQNMGTSIEAKEYTIEKHYNSNSETNNLKRASLTAGKSQRRVKRMKIDTFNSKPTVELQMLKPEDVVFFSKTLNPINLN